jgi:hypothetical protein
MRFKALHVLNAKRVPTLPGIDYQPPVRYLTIIPTELFHLSLTFSNPP